MIDVSRILHTASDPAAILRGMLRTCAKTCAIRTAPPGVSQVCSCGAYRDNAEIEQALAKLDRGELRTNVADNCGSGDRLVLLGDALPLGVPRG